jgi:hypothetical protein
MDEIRLNPGVDYINRLIKEKCSNTNDISDGYHTFGELYVHRIALFQLACRLMADNDTLYGGRKSVWKSKAHSDGTVWDGWFIMGINSKPGEQVTYHLPISEWGNCWYAVELEQAPEYDGHTSDDVIYRLKSI